MAALFLIADILCAIDSPLEFVLRHYWFVEKVKSAKDFLSEGMMLIELNQIFVILIPIRQDPLALFLNTHW